MRCRLLALLLLLGLTVAVVGVQAAPSLAQDTPTSGLPAPDIVPKPNSGAEPTEAGDRGGALQLAVLGLVVVAIGSAAVHLARQSRRARAERGERLRP